MMARLPYVPPGSSIEVDALYSEIREMGRSVLNLYQVLANQRAALAAFIGMSRYVRAESSLDPTLRELVILATARELGQEYELAHHLEAARRAAVPEEKLAALEPGGDQSALTPAERTALEFARQVAMSRDCDNSTFSRLNDFFSNETLVDIIVTTAWYHFVAVILGSLRVELEDDHKPN